MGSVILIFLHIFLGVCVGGNTDVHHLPQSTEGLLELFQTHPCTLRDRFIVFLIQNVQLVLEHHMHYKHVACYDCI